MGKSIIVLSLMMVGCITTPDFETGAGCWRYGVSEEGEVVRPPTERIIYLPDMRSIVSVCDGEAWGCYKEISNTIYLYDKGGKRTLNHEKCHSIGLMKHNNCYGKGYGLGKEVTSCDWNNEQI